MVLRLCMGLSVLYLIWGAVALYIVNQTYGGM